MDDKKLFPVSVWPHLKEKQNTRAIMRDVLIGCLPMVLTGIYFFGLPSAWLILTCVITAVFSEFLWQLLMRQRLTVGDLSGAVTGILLAFCLPPTLPLWMAAIGSIFAIVIVKQFFGGLGYNIFNPALAARAVLLASWPVAMTTWLKPLGQFTWTWPAKIDAVTSATPLGLLKLGENLNQIPSYWNLFIGNIGGSLGETSALAILIGAAYLFYKKVIDVWIPLSYLGTVAILSLILGQDPLFHLLVGGLFLGAFFMATDYVTSPLTKKGKLIFGFGAGILTVLIRLYGGYPEGVCYAILIMNLLTPLIDRQIKPTPYGVFKKQKK